MKKLISRIFIGCLALGVFSVSITALTLGWFVGAGGRTEDEAIDGEIGLRGYFYAGDGTATNPYEIVSPVHFYNLTRLQNLGVFPQKTYFQIGHIFDENDGLRCINPGSENEFDSYLDMSSLSDSIVIPIGSEATPFVGEFRGNGIPIKNLTVTGYPEDIGVFGYVACTGTVDGLVCDNLEIKSLGYNSNSSDADHTLYSVDLDYSFTTAEAMFTGSHYLSNDTSLSVYKLTGSVYTESNLKHPNGLGGTTLLNLNATENRDGYISKVAYFKPTFPNIENDPFTYSWQASSSIISEQEVLDIDGDNMPDKAIVIDMTNLADSSDFNSGSDMEADVRISLVASTEVDGYVFSRVIQTYVIEFYSNGDIFSGESSTGTYSASIFCDYSDDVTVGYRNTNYHHGNNIGFLAGHVDGNLSNSYVYNGKFTFNDASYTPILTESDTGLVGEIGTNVVNGIDPDIGLVTNGDIGIMNFSKIYSMIRDDMSPGHTVYANKGVDSSGGYHSFISYSDFIKSGDSFNNYREYLRTFDTGQGSSVYITGTDADMYNYRETGYTLTSSNIRSDFNSVDFIWNKVIEDEEDADRGLGVFKIVTAKNSGAAQPGAQYSSYALDNITSSRIMNGAEKTKVYFSTAEYDHTKTNSHSWGDYVPFRPDSLPSYSDVNSFRYPFSRDFNYCFELDLSEMSKTAGKNYMYNTDSEFLSNYLSSILIDKYGAPVTPGSSRFGFMFRSSENELLTSLSSYMPLKQPKAENKILHTDGNYYPANSIVFHIENESGANVSVVGNGGDIAIYRNNVSSSNDGITKLYSMRASNFSNSNDAHRYYTYEVEHTEGNVTTPGKTSTQVVVNSDMSTDNNALYGHIFKLPKGDYVIGASDNTTVNVYFLAVQGQTDASIGSKDMADIGNSIERVTFLTEEPTFALFSNNELVTTDVTFKALFNDELGTVFNVITKEEDLDNYLAIAFSDSPNIFVTYLLTYSPTKQVHYINNTRYKDVNIFYRT